MEQWEAAQWGRVAVRPCARARQTETAPSLETSLPIGADDARRRLLQHAVRKHKVLTPPTRNPPPPPRLDRSWCMVEKLCHRVSCPSTRL